jgi:cobalt-zinc-cadmium resistance protein CzcA
MTAELAALGLVPAALSHGIGSETQRPLAVVIVAGTCRPARSRLLLLPVMYPILGTADGARARPTTSRAPPSPWLVPI